VSRRGYFQELVLWELLETPVNFLKHRGDHVLTSVSELQKLNIFAVRRVLSF
jgi:hypothetical protein